MTKEFDCTENNFCFITGKIISNDDTCRFDRFTYNFDAWVSEEGQKMIDEWVASGQQTENPEWGIIYGEWYAEDESTSHILDELEGYIE